MNPQQGKLGMKLKKWMKTYRKDPTVSVTSGTKRPTIGNVTLNCLRSTFISSSPFDLMKYNVSMSSTIPRTSCDSDHTPRVNALILWPEKNKKIFKLSFSGKDVVTNLSLCLGHPVFFGFSSYYFKDCKLLSTCNNNIVWYEDLSWDIYNGHFIIATNEIIILRI